MIPGPVHPEVHRQINEVENVQSDYCTNADAYYALIATAR